MQNKSLRIALVGYGKMGKTIEKIALERGHSISHTIGRNDKVSEVTPKNCDVAIEFSLPEVAFLNLESLMTNNVPTVCGTTGWLDKVEEINALCVKHKCSFLYASNFSIGVNIFFNLNKTLAKSMAKLAEYGVDMQEIHHTQKLDAPSGTAITLAEQIITEIPELDNWSLDDSDHNHIHIDAQRTGDVPGTHVVNYTSGIDQISIKHEAFNRNGFALGAVIAAEYAACNQGILTMNDVLNI
jgi:4-hydroxy-tetrahydrodipicolinate reductase